MTFPEGIFLTDHHNKTDVDKTADKCVKLQLREVMMYYEFLIFPQTLEKWLLSLWRCSKVKLRKG